MSDNKIKPIYALIIWKYIGKVIDFFFFFFGEIAKFIASWDGYFKIKIPHCHGHSNFNFVELYHFYDKEKESGCNSEMYLSLLPMGKSQYH